MKQIYLDNAATTFPKPPEVIAGMVDYMERVGSNVNRGSYAAAYGAGACVLDTRERLCALFGFHEPRNVIFTGSVTLSLNLLLGGFLTRGDHVLTTSMEHNAVLRPLVRLAGEGVKCSVIPCDTRGELCLEQLEKLLCPSTKAIVMTHASNVCGTILPIAAVGAFCKKHGLALIVDCAQTAGTEPIDMEKMRIDALAFTAHKGLLGPQGLGGFVVTDAFAARLTPLIMGGTGSFSNLETMPPVLPDRFEAGTLNLPAIYGLNAALCYLMSVGIDAVRAHERALTRRFLERVSNLARVSVAGMPTSEGRTAVVSLDFLNRDNAEISFLLEQDYGILTRCGLHCAPAAHKTLGTFPRGTVRFSFGHYNTEQEVDFAADAIKSIAIPR